MSEYILNWKAIYNDGTTLLQVNPDGKENSYSNIDRYKLTAFQLYTPNYEKLVYTLALGPGQRLIYRRRVTKEISVGEAEPMDNLLYAIYLVGWQQNIRGKNVKSVSHIMEDSIVQAPEFMTLDRYSGKMVQSDVILRDDEK
jgi:hypothetical protein